MEEEIRDEIKIEQNIEEERISVRSLVEFILREGDIDNRGGGMMVWDAMQMGSRIHRKIQGKMGAEYQAEVLLRHTFPCDGFALTVEGRADGVIEKETENGEIEVTVDEIKGLLRNVAALEEPVSVHLAQAKCYAYFLTLDRNLEKIGVRMSYVNLETEEMKYFTYIYTAEELESWFTRILREYEKWAAFSRNWRKERTASIKKVSFPYDYRPGQLQLASDVYRTISREKLLFLQAPTGVGKTISTLFPAMKAMGEGLTEKLFYLTARTVAGQVAVDTLDLLRNSGLRMKSVYLTAKEKMCFCEEVSCNPQNCMYAKGHYDRINDAIFALISQEDCFSRERIARAAEEYQVCPFELSLDLTLWADAVIGDYNYVFHPRAKLKRFFGEGIKGSYLFLIDEAHNLVDRGRDMYSAALYKEDFLALKKLVKPYSARLSGALERCNKQFLARKRECEQVEVQESVGTLPVSLMNLSGVMEDFFDNIRKKIIAVPENIQDSVRDLYFAVTSFLDTCDVLDEHYVIYDELEPDGRFKVQLYCVNPAANLQDCLDRARSSIFFSATLLPVEYYIRHLCTKEQPYAVYAASVFDPAKMKILVGADVSSRYTRRGPEEYEKIASYLLELVSARRGNYMAFFPSYRLMEDVAEVFGKICPETVDMLIQENRMSEAQREAFLEAFAPQRDEKGMQKKSLLGFCVMGSIFGEGIDLTGDRLIGAAVIGPALPKVCVQQEILKNYYDEHQLDGFYYAYQCPGMNKVQQAAGRVIRTEDDRGVILLLDDRFEQLRYRSMFPREWAGFGYCSRANVAGQLAQFWAQEPVI